LDSLTFLVVNGCNARGRPLPDELLSGYFFHGADFVLGKAGYAAFRAAGGPAPLAEDGCYIHALREGDGYRFAADYCGYRKIFYIHSPGFWAVSNSLWQIARAMRAAGLEPRPDPVELAAMEAEGTLIPTGRGMFFSQLTTFRTVIEGVRLLPRDSALRIGPGGATELPLPPRPTGQDYAATLARALGLWSARIAGLVQAGWQLSADLTGGIDSRTVLALLMAGSGGQALFPRSNLNDRGRADLRVAQDLCRHLGLAHNAPLPQRPPALPAPEAFAAWRDLCLGAYHPIYFPRHRLTPGIAHFGGGGGGNQRSVYDRSVWARLRRLGRPDRFVAARMANLRPAAQRAPYGAALHATLARIASTAPAGMDPLLLHYREFRNRFHAGRTPQYQLSINPLASALLDDCAALAGPARIETAQMFYDMLESLHPGLVERPFDKRHKAIGAARRAALTRVTPDPLPPGRVFADWAPRPPRAQGGPGLMERMANLYARARPLAAQHLPARYLAQADRELERARKTGAFSHPNASKRVGVVAAFALFLAPDP